MKPHRAALLRAIPERVPVDHDHGMPVVVVLVAAVTAAATVAGLWWIVAHGWRLFVPVAFVAVCGGAMFGGKS